MHIKQLAPARVQVKDATTGEVEAVFATLGVKDHDGDIILPGAIKDGTAVAISAFGHSVWKGAPPAGVGTIHEEGDELILKGRYFLDTDHGRNDFHTVKGLAEAGKGEWSFGLVNIEATKGTHNGVNGNLIKSVDVPEVSPVFIGAGINTRTLVAKSAAIEALTQAGIDADDAARMVAGEAVKQYASSLASLLRAAGRERWNRDTLGGWAYVWVEDYDIDAETVVFNIESSEGARMVQVDFDRTDTSVTLGEAETDVHETVQFLPKTLKFSEHLTAVVADVKALSARAEEVVALRAAKGKTISDDASGALGDIADELEHIKSLIAEQPEPPTNPPSEEPTKAIEVDGVVYLLTDSTQEKP